jgi:uncharacterized protein
VISRVLLDSGPLVALLARDDGWHEQCTQQLHSLAPPLLTAWPVLVEADWLLRSHPQAVQQMLHWVHAGVIQVLPIGEEATVWIMAFLRRYQRLHPQIADASLVYLAYKEDIDTVFTLDRRDFATYRFGRNRSFKLLPG